MINDNNNKHKLQVQRWQDSSVSTALNLESKGPGFKSRQSRISPSSILVDKMSSTTCGGNREYLLRTNPPNRDVHNLELYSLTQKYRKGMSSSILWLPALRSINPVSYTHLTLPTNREV